VGGEVALQGRAGKLDSTTGRLASNTNVPASFMAECPNPMAGWFDQHSCVASLLSLCCPTTHACIASISSFGLTTLTSVWPLTYRRGFEGRSVSSCSCWGGCLWLWLCGASGLVKRAWCLIRPRVSPNLGAKCLRCSQHQPDEANNTPTTHNTYTHTLQTQATAFGAHHVCLVLVRLHSSRRRQCCSSDWGPPCPPRPFPDPAAY